MVVDLVLLVDCYVVVKTWWQLCAASLLLESIGSSCVLLDFHREHNHLEDYVLLFDHNTVRGICILLDYDNSCVLLDNMGSYVCY
jgi:hypothetical protein